MPIAFVLSPSFGVLAREAGFSALGATVMSAIVFARSSSAGIIGLVAPALLAPVARRPSSLTARAADSV